MRYALRALLRTPGFTAIAVLTLAVGIGATTTIFAVVDEVMLRPSQRAVDPDVFSEGPLAIPDYELLAGEHIEGVVAIAAVDSGDGLLQIPGRAENVLGSRVSGRYADVTRITPQAGRWIDDNDNAVGETDPQRVVNGVSRPMVFGSFGADVIVISDRIWRDWFNASPSAIGRTVTFNDRVVRIVGVAPAGLGSATDVWSPFGRRRLLTRAELDARRPTRPFYGWKQPIAIPKQPTIDVLMRIAPDQALDIVHSRIKTALRARTPTVEMPESSIQVRQRSANRTIPRTPYIILGFAALIFVAACANLGNMLFARAAEREGEMAVRVALGAGRSRIFGSMFAETALICGAAAIAGLGLAAVALRLFKRAFPVFPIGYWQNITLDLSVDWRIFSFAAAAGLVAAVAVGAASLWRSGRVSIHARLAAAGTAVVARTEGRTLRTMLVAVQVTAAVLLLIATGMLLENTSKQLNRRLWFETGSLVTARIDLRNAYDESRGPHFFERLLADVRGMEGVQAAAVADALPAGEKPSPRGGSGSIAPEPPKDGWRGAPIRINGKWIHASPGFYDTLGLSIVRGRDFRESDQAGSEPVVMVTESTARALWSDADPIGKRIVCCGETVLRRVVGLVPDPVGAVKRETPLDEGEAMREASGDSGGGVFVFIPAAQAYQRQMLLVVRADTPRAILQPLRDRIAALDSSVAVFEAGPVAATQFTKMFAERGVRLLAGALGLIALAIAVLGVYAVVSYFVSRRAREFGLRLALGSTRRQIGKLVVDYAIHIILIGLLPGVLFASWATRYFQVELQKLHPSGLTVWIAVPLLMLTAGVIAAYVPARRAAKTDPYTTLKDL